jgi:hypothetical protein
LRIGAQPLSQLSGEGADIASARLSLGQCFAFFVSISNHEAIRGNHSIAASVLSLLPLFLLEIQRTPE